MRRRCNGSDPYLTRHVGYDEEMLPQYETCKCGAVFDDVECSTVYPHKRITSGYDPLVFSTDDFFR